MNKKQKELLSFGVVGVLGYVVDVLITSLLHPLAGPYVARIPSFICAATVTWAFNRKLTFANTEKRHRSLLKEYLHYLGLMIFGLVVNYIVYAISITLIGGDKRYAIVSCVALGSLAGMVVNYMNSKKHLYRTKQQGEKTTHE